MSSDSRYDLPDIEDEYDPSIPNVYDEIIKQNEKHLQRQSEPLEANECFEDNPTATSSVKYASDPQGPSPSAMALLMKMGWKAGKGLGKNQQGITAPLMVTQTSQGSGVIEQGEELEIRPKERPRGTPTSSLCLLNVIDINDIDDDLEGEIADEASRFGNLEQVRLEKNPQHWDPTEQVKIICEYETVEDAMKALMHFNGRRQTRQSHMQYLLHELLQGINWKDLKVEISDIWLESCSSGSGSGLLYSNAEEKVEREHERTQTLITFPWTSLKDGLHCHQEEPELDDSYLYRACVLTDGDLKVIIRQAHVWLYDSLQRDKHEHVNIRLTGPTASGKTMAIFYVLLRELAIGKVIVVSYKTKYLYWSEFEEGRIIIYEYSEEGGLRKTAADGWADVPLNANGIGIGSLSEIFSRLPERSEFLLTDESLISVTLQKDGSINYPRISHHVNWIWPRVDMNELALIRECCFTTKVDSSLSFEDVYSVCGKDLRSWKLVSHLDNKDWIEMAHTSHLARSTLEQSLDILDGHDNSYWAQKKFKSVSHTVGGLEHENKGNPFKLIRRQNSRQEASCIFIHDALFDKVILTNLEALTRAALRGSHHACLALVINGVERKKHYCDGLGLFEGMKHRFINSLSEDVLKPAVEANIQTMLVLRKFSHFNRSLDAVILAKDNECITSSSNTTRIITRIIGVKIIKGSQDTFRFLEREKCLVNEILYVGRQDLDISSLDRTLDGPKYFWNVESNMCRRISHRFSHKLKQYFGASSCRR